MAQFVKIIKTFAFLAIGPVILAVKLVVLVTILRRSAVQIISRCPVVAVGMPLMLPQEIVWRILART
jgi:hypothetical protein